MIRIMCDAFLQPDPRAVSFDHPFGFEAGQRAIERLGREPDLRCEIFRLPAIATSPAASASSSRRSLSRSRAERMSRC